MKNLTSKVLGTIAGIALATNVAYSAPKKDGVKFTAPNVNGDEIEYSSKGGKWVYIESGKWKPTSDQRRVDGQYDQYLFAKARADTQEQMNADAGKRPLIASDFNLKTEDGWKYCTEKVADKTTCGKKPEQKETEPAKSTYEIGATYTMGEDSRAYGANLVTPGNIVYELRVGSMDTEKLKSVNEPLKNEVVFSGIRERRDRKTISVGAGYTLDNVVGRTDVPIMVFANHEMGTQHEDESFVKRGAVQDRKTSDEAYTKDSLTIEAGIRIPDVLLQVGTDIRVGWNPESNKYTLTFGLFREVK